ncbi:hypothetical protein ACN4EG_05225 [Alkalinema pantanalense CENA528]|uniref:hypothetical protein n=1 Tax=Alkalinema pantanalense TaxID=1620705 RepID=UPI003D6F3EA8
MHYLFPCPALQGTTSYQIITDKHGGHLECHSTPGQGTEFVIQIPIHQRGKSAEQSPLPWVGSASISAELLQVRG